MTTPNTKTTYTLDDETTRALAKLAQHWNLTEIGTTYWKSPRRYAVRCCKWLLRMALFSLPKNGLDAL